MDAPPNPHPDEPAQLVDMPVQPVPRPVRRGTQPQGPVPACAEGCPHAAAIRADQHHRDQVNAAELIGQTTSDGTW